MGTFLDDAKAAQDEKREKDPAIISDSKDPWATPETTDETEGSASDSASGKAGAAADEKKRQAPPRPPKRGAAPTRTPALRRGRPRGPARKAITARILAKNDRMLTKAVEITGKNPQTLIDEALEAHFRRLKIQDPGEPPTEGSGAA